MAVCRKEDEMRMSLVGNDGLEIKRCDIKAPWKRRVRARYFQSHEGPQQCRFSGQYSRV